MIGKWSNIHRTSAIVLITALKNNHAEVYSINKVVGKLNIKTGYVVYLKAALPSTIQ